MALNSASDPLEQLRFLRKQIQSTVQDDCTREKMMFEARKLMLDLERPHEVIHRIGFQLMETVACSIACKMGLFKALPDETPVSAEQMAKACNADPLLVARVLQCLASYGAVAQDQPNSYRSNAVSRTLSTKWSEAAIEFDLEFHSRGWARLPSFLEERGWKNFTQGHDTPLTKAWGMPEGSTIFQVLDGNPHNDAFNTYMSVLNDGHVDWTDLYPVRERLINGASTDTDAVMMVDVGGGLGHQGLAFKKAFPDAPGRFVDQDLEHAFPAPSQRSPDMEYMLHDFTTEQPVKGARFYYMRYVPHDWSQDVAANICSQIRKAMKPGYSRLIINEWIIPEIDPSMYMTSMDLCMMCSSGGMERTEELHREYLTKAGLKVTNVYRPADSYSEGVIEAEIAE